MTTKETDLAQFIVIHYHHLLTFDELSAYKYHLTVEKAASESEKFGEMLRRRWGAKNKEALKLIEGGYNDFKEIVAYRILSEHANEVLINNCPKCGKLARTPLAKQCRFCGNAWV